MENAPISPASIVGDYGRLHIRVKATTDVGQAIAISGNSYALGNGSKERVVNLVTNPESYPIWYTTSPILIPRGEFISYRYCLMEGGAVKAFERPEDAREFIVDQLDTTVEDNISLQRLEGFGKDSETELFQQMKTLIKPRSEAHKLDHFITAAQRETRLFLVCYHLPVTIKRRDPDQKPSPSSYPSSPFDVTWNDSLIARTANSVSESMKTVWVGTLPGSITKTITAEEKEALRVQLSLMDCIPVFIDERIRAAAYYGFCKQIMWPVFHNVDQLDQIHAAWNLQTSSESKASGNTSGAADLAGNISTSASAGTPAPAAAAAAAAGGTDKVLEWNILEEEYHLAHSAVNKIFARTLLGLVQNEDVVWVHDYHLMALPKLLRDAVDSNAPSTNNQTQNPAPVAEQGEAVAPSPAKRPSHTQLLDIYRDAETRNVSSATTDAYEIIEKELDAPMDTPSAVHDLRIIFFMHIPFPTSQIFRTLSRATELLQSMICADVVGFHAFDHARHFLNATKRMLGIRSGSRAGGLLTLFVGDREVIVSVSHVSIETDRIASAATHPETLRIAQELREKHAGKRIVAGLDACQRLSGVALKLAAFDKLLADSSWGKRGNIVLVQRCVRGGSRAGDEQTTSNDLQKMVADINHKYVTSAAAVASRLSSATAALNSHNSFASNNSNSSGNSSANVNAPPAVDGDGNRLSLGGSDSSAKLEPQSLDVVDYAEVGTHKGLSIHERMALWMVADVILLTPIREGLNLYPLEYIYARRELPNPGVVVVSEFSTCSALLNGSLKVNPFAPLQVADALEKALMLSTKDKELRRQRDLPFISSHPSNLWTQQIINDLEQLGAAHRSNGLAHKKVHVLPTALDIPSTVQYYEDAVRDCGICERGSRVFIFDYGGTLLPKEKYDIYIKRQTLSAIAGRKPSAKIMSSIEKLSNDPRNIVMVVTGLTKLKLGDTFKGMKNVSLVTSNGLVYSWGANLQPAPHKKRPRSVKSASIVSAATGADASASATVVPALGGGGGGGSAGSGGGGGSVLGGAGSGANTMLTTLVEEGDDENDDGGPAPLLLPEAISQKQLAGKPKSDDLLAQTLADPERTWDFLESHIDWAAVASIAIPIITKFTYRTNGTCQTPRIPGIGWSYFGADPEEGYMQSRQLSYELEAALANFDVKIASLIQGSIEVVPRTLQKGFLVKPLLERVQKMRGGKLPGFLMVVGDEEADDVMVEMAYDVLSHAAPDADMRRCKTFTVSVGKRSCPAQFYVNGVSDVERLLVTLARSSSTTTATVVPAETGDEEAMIHVVDSVLN
mmetsp:Transcript_30642/g.51813  ORF Transcript_30642/g.51813 Transcript_30642/m.51813 type:complete len:1299 (+) Transcript_30642:113-4009(+)|eukprot:CAMPEP_0174977272 /NCGR_PEP_ID=MMETSP0004_2-20121128/13513_1 /TAXON_ID=420556 /ORGANISM="Ochromonas sp., Strain CCMP1393" /LENGTH=1298 /DNA_ID=CAMNT_0016228429 /DNA_START=85 /DNA_END=3981 /DNA_ORIENTATION=-